MSKGKGLVERLPSSLRFLFFFSYNLELPIYISPLRDMIIKNCIFSPLLCFAVPASSPDLELKVLFVIFL